LGDGKFSFDFTEDPANESLLAKKNASLQSDPASNFVLNLVAQQRSRDEHRTLRGRVFSVVKTGGIKTTTLESPEALVSILANEFLLDVDDVAGLWPRIAARHEELFGNDSPG
jgi:arylamine N-acetyltransferase